MSFKPILKLLLVVEHSLAIPEVQEDETTKRCASYMKLQKKKAKLGDWQFDHI